MSTPPLFGSYRLGMYRDIVGGTLLWGLIIWGAYAGWHYYQAGKQIAQLKDPSADVRMNASAQLALHPSSRAVQPLIDALNDQDGNVIDSATVALGKSNDPRAVPALMALLRQKGAGLGTHGVEALGQLGALAVPSLVAALKDPDPYVREPAREALEKAGNSAVDPLIALLHDPDPNMQQTAANTLGALKSSRAVDPLLEALHSSDPALRSAAAGALGQIGDKRAADPLLAALQDPSGSVRSDAAGALGSLKESRAVPQLIAFSNGQDADLGNISIRSLAEIDDSQADGYLMAQFRARNWNLIAQAATFFVSRGDAGSEDVLIQALDKTGSQSLAVTLLNSGNEKLHTAADDWATKNNYVITYIPGSKSTTWGSK